MGLRRQWAARVESVGTRLKHFYTGNTLTGARYTVYLNVVITDGPEKGREVVLELDPLEAEILAGRLTKQAVHTQTKNEAM